MKKILQSLFDHKTLQREMAREILINISNGHYNEHEVTAFVTVFLMRNITIDELMGFRDALLMLCTRFQVEGTELVDIVGTGGDGKNSFNISTLACFIVAGAGKKVAKHGNYGSSSISGASNVMERLGYKHKNDPTALTNELEKANICFLHAPLFHPALKTVSSLRRNLGIRTFFNMLGPLVNPLSPSYSLIGVYNLEIARVYQYVLQELGKPFTIVHSLDGYDEISLTSDIKIITQDGERIATPEELGRRIVIPEDIFGGGTVEEAARIFSNVISGNGTFAQNAVVLANAAMALFGTGAYPNYEDAYQAAVQSLDSGMAKKSFDTLINLQP